GLVKAGANAVTSRLNSEDIIAASQKPQSVGSALTNVGEALSLNVATHAQVGLDQTDAVADGLIQASALAPPTPLSVYLGILGADYKAGEATSTFDVDSSKVALDEFNFWRDPSTQNKINMLLDNSALLSDVSENIALSVT